jgi:hypothetical protein
VALGAPSGLLDAPNANRGRVRGGEVHGPQA